MKSWKHGIPILIGLVAILINPTIGPCDGPEHMTILYTSDELGYLEPCG